MKNTSKLVILFLIFFSSLLYLAYKPSNNNLQTKKGNNVTTIIKQNNLEILTKSLPNGKLNSNYKTVLEGFSNYPDQTLDLRATNIPGDLDVTNCSHNETGNKTYISCSLQGKIAEPGNFEVMLILSDGYDKEVKYLKLNID